MFGYWTHRHCVWRCSCKSESFTYFLLRKRKAVCVSCWNSWCTKPWIQRELRVKTSNWHDFESSVSRLAHWKLGAYWFHGKGCGNRSRRLFQNILPGCKALNWYRVFWLRVLFMRKPPLIFEISEVTLYLYLCVMRSTSQLDRRFLKWPREFLFFLSNERLACFVPGYGYFTRHKFEQVLHTF